MSSELIEDPRYPPSHGSGASKKSRRERVIRQQKFDEQNGQCYWCGGWMSMEPLARNINGDLKDNGKFATFEHLVPKSEGGRRATNSSNVVLAHAHCNRKRERLKFPHDPVYGVKR